MRTCEPGYVADRLTVRLLVHRPVPEAAQNIPAVLMLLRHVIHKDNLTNVVFFHLGDSPASEFYVPTFGLNEVWANRQEERRGGSVYE